MKNNSINSNAYAYVLSILSEDIKVVDAYVKGRWLKCELNTGVIFSVKNFSGPFLELKK